jgi:hypothetical protein
MPGRPPEVRNDLVVLQQWALFGRTHAPRRVSRLNWSAAGQLIDAARPYLLEDAMILRGLLQEWSRKFGMQDPLLNDLGAHRWIDKERSYSDWLAWVLERLEASAVFEVLNVKPPFDTRDAGKCLVRRESQLDKQYIDLLVCFEGKPDYAIGVEVKTYDEQYAKQSDYRKELEGRFSDPPCVLIAILAIDEDCLYGFTLRPWRNVTFSLREKIAEYGRRNGTENRIVVAMMLGFVAAVEQNLLKFSPVAPRRVSNGLPTVIPEDLVKYLGGEK